MKGLTHTLVISAVAVAALSGFVLFGLGGWTYYTTPMAVRGYAEAHRMLRPSGSVGQWFGIAGFALMLVPVAYSARKKIRRFREAGSMKNWLEVHVFCGIVGPVFVTFHTSFKFNGIVSVAYWSMVAVTLSGFIGRYLYVRIPRSLRGQELTQAEIEARAQELGRKIAEAGLPESVLSHIEAFETRATPRMDRPPSLVSLAVGEIRMRRELADIRREIEPHGEAPRLQREAIALIAERAALVRRTAYLTKTKKLFDLWHVFHMPLVYVMFAIVLVHVAVTMYMGYVPFGR